MATVTLHGDAVQLHGELPAVGSAAPDFRLVDRDLNDVSLDTFKDARKLLSIVPSLDTPVCATSTERFNQEAGGLGPKAVVLVVSADLPFAMKRYCDSSASGIERVVTLSMMRSREFARDYGVLIAEGPLAGITARAVLVLDAGNTVVHAELVPDVGSEPDYAAALAALRAG